jgi:chemotaxis protein MotB
MNSRVRASGLAAAIATVATLSTGCLVSKRDLDTCTADSANAKAAADTRERDMTAHIADLQQQLATAQATTQDRDAKLADLGTGVHNLQAQLDEATAINQELRAALERLGKDADKLLADKGTLSKALDDAKSRLEELRRTQAAAEARTALLRDFAVRFKALVTAGQLRLETRRGQLVLDVAGDLLFDPDRAEIRGAGKGALMEIARALQTATAPPNAARRFLVTDHVDDAPIKSRHLKTPWDLTTARAAAAVDYLVSLGVPATSLTAAGAGSFDPLVPNDSTDDRAKNRRLEIAVLADAAPAATPAPSPSVTPAPPPPAASAAPPGPPTATK